MSGEKVARHQRSRLLGAMIDATARHGYPGVTLSEVVGLAGVSKTTFYELFESKEDCFFAAFDEIMEQTARRASEAYADGTDHRDGLLRALHAYVELIAARPDAASLVLIESLSLGAAGAPQRERGVERFELLLRRTLEHEGAAMSELAIRGIAGGARRVAYRRLREGHPERFGDHAEELVEWALGYQGREVPPPADAQGGTPPPERAARAAEEGRPPWEERPSSKWSRATLSQRERIMRAVAQLAAERGYGRLSVPAISTAAGVSNQTFYQEFAGKQEAFLAAFDELAAWVLNEVTLAFEAEADWIGGARAGLTTLLSLIAANPRLARFAFFELSAAGPAGRDAAELATERIMAFLTPDLLPDGVADPPAIVVEAIGGGVWTIIQHEIVQERPEAIPHLGPALLDFMLAPLGVEGSRPPPAPAWPPPRPGRG
jgi:AcrR family transcriptional regulator